MRGYLNEGRTWLEELLSCDSSGGNPVSTDIRAKALNSASMLVTELGDYGQAALLVEESMGLFQELGDKRGRAAALNTRGIVAKLQGNYAYSATLYRSEERRVGKE